MKQSRHPWKITLFTTGLMVVAGTSLAQIANPADAIEDIRVMKPPQPVEQAYRPWTLATNSSAAITANRSKTNMPDLVAVKSLMEEQRIGPYRQPEWTTARRFPTTRVYLQQMPYAMGVEQWDRIREYKDGSVEQRFSEEFEIGLPYRFQLDLYETWIADAKGIRQNEESVELRWALADWGRIPMNPTLYAEYTFGCDDPDAVEVKLLLGDELDTCWHYGINLICEQGLWGSRATELAVSAALGRVVIDRTLSLGLEGKYINATEEGSRENPEEQVLLGPSIQWRITPEIHFDAVPLFGLTHDSPRTECWVVLGYDFGFSNHKQMNEAPISTKGR